jgi:hypothetical protein
MYKSRRLESLRYTLPLKERSISAVLESDSFSRRLRKAEFKAEIEDSSVQDTMLY